MGLCSFCGLDQLLFRWGEGQIDGKSPCAAHWGSVGRPSQATTRMKPMNPAAVSPR